MSKQQTIDTVVGTVTKQGAIKLAALVRDLNKANIAIKPEDILVEADGAAELTADYAPLLSFIGYKTPMSETTRFILVPAGTEIAVEGDDEGEDVAGEMLELTNEAPIIDEASLSGYVVRNVTTGGLDYTENPGAAMGMAHKHMAEGHEVALYGALGINVNYELTLAPLAKAPEAGEVAEDGEEDGDEQQGG